jgi:hypothetical protein
MPELHVLRGFCGEDGGGGNPLGVFLEGAEVRAEDRQWIAAELGFSETVFVDDAGRGEIRIFTPATELPFAGHPVVGTAWLLARERGAVAWLRPPAGEAGRERADLRRRPPGVDARVRVRGGRVGGGSGGARRASCGPRCRRGLGVGREGRRGDPRAGLRAALQDRRGEATGSAAITLSALIGSELEIRQGAGSRILARHSATGWWRSAGGWSSMGARVSSGDLSDPPVLWSANARASPWGYSLPGVGGVAKVGFAAAF